MKHFAFRLFLIRKLIESLMWSCIDEYAEFEEIADGLAKAHSAMDRKSKPEPVDPELVEACRRIIAAGACECAEVLCETYDTLEGWVKCPNYGKEPSEAWSCSRSADSARRWLAEHGIKE